MAPNGSGAIGSLWRHSAPLAPLGWRHWIGWRHWRHWTGAIGLLEPLSHSHQGIAGRKCLVLTSLPGCHPTTPNGSWSHWSGAIGNGSSQGHGARQWLQDPGIATQAQGMVSDLCLCVLVLSHACAFPTTIDFHSFLIGDMLATACYQGGERALSKKRARGSLCVEQVPPWAIAN